MNLRICPRKTISWAEFCSKAGPWSIALDGYVHGEPLYNPDGPYVNFNHHEDVDRLATRSTSGQVFMAIKMGLMGVESFGSHKGRMNIYVNDCDQDVCLSVWLLKNADRLASSEPLLNRLVWVSDVMDACAGAYPFSTFNSTMQELAWIYQPYMENRAKVGSLEVWEMQAIIEAVGHRIDQHLMGRGETIEVYGKFDTVYKEEGWMMVRESGPYARTAMKVHGITAFVSMNQISAESPNIHGNWNWKYSIGTLTPYVRFPIQQIYEALNLAELSGSGLSAAAMDSEWARGNGWGGSNTIGGGPRKGSILPPENVRDIINGVYAKNLAGWR